MPRCFNRFLLRLFCLLLVFTSLQVKASDKPEGTTQPKWQQLISDKAFNYKNELERKDVVRENKPNAFENMLRDIGRFLGNDSLWRVIWIMLGIVAIYVVYKLVLSNEHTLFGRKKKAIDTGAEDGVEQMGISNWEALLQKAVADNDLQLAVRYSYMWLLQMLQESELIEYREDKTNFDYYKELQQTAYKQPFKQISRQYEYVHYGNYPLSAAAYNQYIDLFNNVKKQLGR